MKLLLFGALFILLVSAALAQDDPQTRSITADDFSSQRPTGAKTTAKRVTRRARYKYVARQGAVRRRKSNPPRPKTLAQPGKVAELGVTMWRMRTPSRSDVGAKLLPVQLPDGGRAMWTPERVGTETVFRKGDRVRLAIESSVSGYLYVIDSETYGDGTFGEPYLIFPAKKDDDNAVAPGMLVDIPDQAEDLPYFLINPKGSNYTGELLTVIISPEPIRNIETDEDGLITNLDNLIDLEEIADAEIFSRTDLLDKIFTQIEAHAACGAITRQLVREKSIEKPCGPQTRQLTREEPLPQSIYRVRTIAGQPVVAFVRLASKGDG